MLPIVSRLLLCLCLLVDTIGPAMAATHLARSATSSQPASSEPAAPAAVAVGGCHDAGAGAVGGGPAAAPAEPADEACVERCLELCLQHGVATLPASAGLTVPPGAMPAAPATGTQVPHARALPPLRPPIG